MVSGRDLYDYLFDRYDEAECAEFARLQAERERPPAEVRQLRRCHGCGYALGTAGHRVSCLAVAA